MGCAEFEVEGDVGAAVAVFAGAFAGGEEGREGAVAAKAQIRRLLVERRLVMREA